jgi:hypothetical protein
MGEAASGGLQRVWFTTAVVAAVVTVALQSVVHLTLVLDAHRVDTLLDLERSNGLPDILSTLALGVATAGAVALSIVCVGGRAVALALAGTLALLGLADIMHVGAHPAPTSGKIVIAIVLLVGALLVMVGRRSPLRVRATLAAAGGVLVCSFLIIGLDREFPRLERARGDPIGEYQIVAKEGLELLGWSLVALALCDEALRRRRAHESGATARASRAPAAPRRHAA